MPTALSVVIAVDCAVPTWAVGSLVVIVPLLVVDCWYPTGVIERRLPTARRGPRSEVFRHCLTVPGERTLDA